ncbi:metallophosphoesterase family protein [Shimia sp. W99]
MTAFTFLHSSDLHLGKGFGRMPQDLRGRLIEARHEVLSTLAKVARAHGAGHVLLAGDTFDTTGPSEQVRRQAATAMRAADDVDWWVLPGNHDSLGGEELWARFEDEAGDNVHVLRRAAPVAMAPGVHLLPSPWPHRFPGRDLTGWMVDCATPTDEFRIGLAHGGVVDFGENFDSSATIPPDRDKSARLDYLALGDWHGPLSIGPRVQFSGSPERDRFRHAGCGTCHVVTLDAPGALPRIEQVDTGRFDWGAPTLALTPGQDVAGAFEALLPTDRSARRDQLLKPRLQGFLRLSERAALEAAIAEACPDFALLEVDQGELATEYEAGDIDQIAPSGALREAVDALVAEATQEGGDTETAELAQAALNRLWSLVREV